MSMGVYGILRRSDGRILLLLRPPHKKTYASYWNLVGGKQEDGETPEQTIVREAAEEIGIAVTTKRYLGEYESAGLLVKLFEIEQQGSGKIAMNDEHVAMRWVSPEEARSLKMMPYLEKLFDDLRKEEST